MSIKYLTFSNDTDDRQKIINFLNTLRQNQTNKEIWQWQFNYIPSSTVLTMCKDENEVIGTQFMMPIEINFFGEVILSGKCENSYLKTEYRGKKIFDTLFDFAVQESKQKQMKLLWAFTPAVKVYEKNLKFQLFENCMNSYRLQIGLPSFNYLEASSKNIIKLILKFGWYSARYFLFFLTKTFITLKYSDIKKKYESSEKVKNNTDIKKLYSKLRNTYKNFIHLDMNENYIKWRVSGNPNINYTCVYFYKENNLAGYYVLSLDNKTANVSDFTYESRETSVVMLLNLINFLSKRKIYFCYYHGNRKNELNNNTFKLFSRFGWNRLDPSGGPFVFRKLSGLKNNSINSSENWYLNGLWTEGYRL